MKPSRTYDILRGDDMAQSSSSPETGIQVTMRNGKSYHLDRRLVASLLLSAAAGTSIPGAVKMVEPVWGCWQGTMPCGRVRGFA